MSGLFKLTLLGLLVVGIAMNVMFGDSGGNYHGFNMNEHGFYVVDFLVFVLVIGYFVKKPAKKFLESRHEAVRSEMDEAGKVLSDAQERLTQYEGQLQGLSSEAQQMADDFKADGNREKTRLEDETTAAVAKIKRDLDTRMNQENARIRGELQVRVCTEALELAEQKIRSSMDKSTQRRLVKQYIEDLQKIEQLGEIRRESA